MPTEAEIARMKRRVAALTRREVIGQLHGCEAEKQHLAARSGEDPPGPDEHERQQRLAAYEAALREHLTALDAEAKSLAGRAARGSVDANRFYRGEGLGGGRAVNDSR